MRAFFTAALVCALPIAAQAQEGPKIVSIVAVPAQIDPERLAAARAFVDVILPPDSREAMFETVITQMMGTMLAGLEQNSELDALAAEDPQVREVMSRFVARQHQRAIKLFRDSMPEMLAAYANAYARNFTVEDLKALTAFFSSPVGRSYSQTAPKLLGDPDFVAWTQHVMAESRKAVPDEMKRLKDELEPLTKDKQHAS